MTDLKAAASDRAVRNAHPQRDRAQRRIARIASGRVAASTARGLQVIRLDGRTRVVGAKRGVVWAPVDRPVLLDRTTVECFHQDGVNALLCRRGLRHARVTLSWLRS